MNRSGVSTKVARDFEGGSTKTANRTRFSGGVFNMRRWQILAVAMSMIGALLGSGGVVAAQSDQLHVREAKAALQVINEIQAGGGRPHVGRFVARRLGSTPVDVIRSKSTPCRLAGMADAD